MTTFEVGWESIWSLCEFDHFLNQINDSPFIILAKLATKYEQFAKDKDYAISGIIATHWRRPSQKCSTSNASSHFRQTHDKAMRNRTDDYPSSEYFRALHPRLANVVAEKCSGALFSQADAQEVFAKRWQRKLVLQDGIPVSAAIIDARAGVLGCGAGDDKPAPGVVVIVVGGILPGPVRYETGQSAVGDAFNQLRRTLGKTGPRSWFIGDRFRRCALHVLVQRLPLPL